MTVEVIGCDLGRTGTTSLKLALEQLGLPTYHMTELRKHEAEDASKWKAIVDCNGDNYDWNELFIPSDGRPPYRAVVDWPTTTYYKSILAKYSNAKLILTVRDSAEQWLESMKATLGASKDGQTSDLAKLKQQIIWNHPDMFGGGFPENAIQVYNAWNAKVQADIPADRLLVLNVKDGWRTLCEFLGIPVIDGPFPHANDRESYISHHQNRAQ
ncbi:hypothetical protein LEN26_007768 [Aphanomyces euteiches]|nr:hypothetical protein AeMF1_018393 [Aphanomyces euteiches]KAH9131304.1 hypothetical protein LEN26_007768 [Aphanomyces euteiches]KAH9131382.1 hypothetical protein AeNC1_019675 [Aphanomyces euteiches]